MNFSVTIYPLPVHLGLVLGIFMCCGPDAFGFALSCEGVGSGVLAAVFSVGLMFIVIGCWLGVVCGCDLSLCYFYIFYFIVCQWCCFI